MGGLESFMNKYDGERVFLIGNGPSLAETPLEKLDDEYTVGMNKINHIYEDTDWRPTFYVLSQQRLTRTNVKKFAQENIGLGIPCFFNSCHKNEFGNTGNIQYLNIDTVINGSVDSEFNLHETPLEEVEEIDVENLYEFWSDDITEKVFSYHTMYCVLQLVFYMGFDEIYLIGCDLGFEYHDPHMIFQSGLDPLQFDRNSFDYIREAQRNEDKNITASIINGIVYKLYKTPIYPLINLCTELVNYRNTKNHFNPDYRVKPKDERPVNEEIRRSHLVARRIAKNKGINIYNATIGGELDVYPRVDIYEVV